MANGEPLQNENINRLLKAFCSLETPDEAHAFLADLCTQREIADLAQRLEVASLLAEGRSYLNVSRATGASSTTVSRVSKCLNGPAGGYRLVLERLDESVHEADCRVGTNGDADSRADGANAPA